MVAERQGQVAALNMLGERQQFTDAPFFWSAHYDTSIRYVGHAQGWDAVEIDGDIAAADASVRYKTGGRTIVVATVGRDREALEAAAAMNAGSDNSSAFGTYEKGVKVSNSETASLNITGDTFHPEWNYTIKPRRQHVTLIVADVLNIIAVAPIRVSHTHSRRPEAPSGARRPKAPSWPR